MKQVNTHIKSMKIMNKHENVSNQKIWNLMAAVCEGDPKSAEMIQVLTSLTIKVFGL